MIRHLFALCLLLIAAPAFAQQEIPIKRGYAFISGSDTVRVSGSGVTVNGVGYAKSTLPRDSVAATAFTPAVGQQDSLAVLSYAGNQTVSLPANSAAAFDVGTYLFFQHGSASGSKFFASDGTSTVNPADTLTSRYATIVYEKTGTDEWTLLGGSGGASGGGVGTDDQTIDVFAISDNTLSLSLEDDGEAAQTVNLGGLRDSLSVWGTEDPEAPSGAANLDRLYYIERTGGSIQPDSLFYWASADSLARIIVADTLAGADTLFYVASGGGGGSYTTVWYQDTFTNATASAILVASYTGTETKPAGAGSYAELTGTNFSVQPRDVLYNGDADDVVSLDMGEAFPSGGWRYRGDWYSSNGFGGGVGVCFGATSATLAGSGLCVQWEDNRFDVGTELDNFSTASDTPGAGELFIGAVDGQGPHEVEITFDPGGGATGDLTVTLYDTDDTTVLVTDTFTGLTIPSGQFFIMRMQQDREIETHTLYE